MEGRWAEGSSHCLCPSRRRALSRYCGSSANPGGLHAYAWRTTVTGCLSFMNSIIPPPVNHLACCKLCASFSISECNRISDLMFGIGCPHVSLLPWQLQYRAGGGSPVSLARYRAKPFSKIESKRASRKSHSSLLNVMQAQHDQHGSSRISRKDSVMIMSRSCNAQYGTALVC